MGAPPRLVPAKLRGSDELSLGRAPKAVVGALRSESQRLDGTEMESPFGAAITEEGDKEEQTDRQDQEAGRLSCWRGAFGLACEIGNDGVCADGGRRRG